ncbi:M20/M25/M40 family metallo-hydrolase [Flavobacteriaceae bacterium]|jgi:glutamate carboxypeptidase|nr:M20/M25/M40 family metallo-hydrolase [Flavobacteriaceae bacterium]MDA9305858.1 M20/M25/M40 family metallo-hydrolase [Flavobacteriaceae bacterium]MDB2491704.1 M20/M25/M40 family metallo-hydrolase [Flavobacteriaceae bacterium]MDB2695429.1 M20/M25/M40 family metallo-hydrolase [Flavobacteriaceae bacterium]MDB4281150.1 M20/M25/M40 family metallo-hydrolase [Flavobacteriaceae bacterium]
MKKQVLTFLFILFIQWFSNAQKLSRIEKKIVKKVQTMDNQSIDFLEKIVNINSGTLNKKGVREVGIVFDTAFKSIGFTTEWIEMPEEMNRAGHFFASLNGTKGKKLLLIGHLDTVFEENSPFQKFEKTNDSIAYGPGANDMKGGDVVVFYALKALADLNLLKDANITVAFTGDEESTGKPLSISRKELIEAAKGADIALGFETSTGFDNATIARRGASGWKVEVEGKRAHSSGIFSDYTGAGAIFEMSRILNSFYEQVRGEEYLTFNPGTLLGGTFINYDSQTSSGDTFGKTNVVAQTSVVHGGLRFISEEQKENARAKMREIVSNNLPQTKAKISFTDSYPAMGPTDGNRALLAILNEVSLSLGHEGVTAYDPGRRGAADISFVADYVDGLDGLGTMGNGAHTPKETVNLKTMNALIQRTAIFIYRLISMN